MNYLLGGGVFLSGGQQPCVSLPREPEMMSYVYCFHLNPEPSSKDSNVKNSTARTTENSKESGACLYNH